MDFSKVRPNFGQARLHEVLTNESSTGENQSFTNGPHFSKEATDITEMSGFGSLDDPLVATALAHAPQYNVTSIGQLSCAPDVLNVDLDPISGYCLAVFPTGLAIWKQSANQRIFFALPENHDVVVKFVRPRIDNAVSVQPHIVLVDTRNGDITYFDSVSQTVMGPDNLRSLPLGCTAKLPLNDTEVVRHIEIVDNSPSVSGLGFVAATSGGHLFWVNLRNELGKIAIKTTKMRHGGGFLDKLRSLGAFSQDIVAIRLGNRINTVRNDDFSGSEVAVINRYGDVTIWKVGAEGAHSLVTEVRTEPRIKTQLDVRYPHSSETLHAHDLTFENDLIHVLVSLKSHESPGTRTFLVATFRSDFDLVSVRRLLTYESMVSEENPDALARLHVTSSGMLVVVAGDAVSMIESPTVFGKEFLDHLPPARWEECLYLKDTVKVLNSKLGYNESVVIVTNDDLINLQICNFDRSKPQISTTEARLEQAVFQSSVTNPFELRRWSPWESAPDVNAPRNLALEIANAHSTYIPDKLPSLSVHLKLREDKILDLHNLVSTQDVKEVAQALEAAVVLQENINIPGLDKLAISAGEDPSESALVAELQHDVMKVPFRLERMAETASSSQNHSSLELHETVASLVLTTLKKCEEHQLGVPAWATHVALQNCLEILTNRATESADADLLGTVTDILCAIDAANKSINKSLTHQLLIKLAELESTQAIAIATKYHLYATLARLEVDQWLNSNDSLTVIEHIAKLPATYAENVFDTLVTGRNLSELVNELAKAYPDKVKKFLSDNALHSITWTLAPTTPESTEELRLATKAADDIDERQLYASLYKLSAHFTGGGSVVEAQHELDLVNAHSVLTLEFQEYQDSSSCLLNYDIEKLRNGEFTREVAVDLYALAPPQAVPESNDYFVMAFQLVDPSDKVRQNLLIQQIIIKTNWERVNTETQRKVKQTLYYHTLRRLPIQYASLLQNFRCALVPPEPAAVRKAWNSDICHEILPELTETASRAVSIADKYKVDELVASLFENSMDFE